MRKFKWFKWFKWFSFDQLALALILALLMTACSKDDEKTQLSIDARPAWTEVTQGVVPQGMYIIMDADGLPTVDGVRISVHTDDLLAAFVEGECRGVSKPYAEIDGKTHFYLKVRSTEADTGSVSVELRYYSALRQHIFTSQTFSFVANDNLGTLDEGYQPIWK